MLSAKVDSIHIVIKVNINFVCITATKTVFNGINVSVDFYVSAKRQMIGGYSSSLGRLVPLAVIPSAYHIPQLMLCSCQGNLLEVKGG